MAKVIIPPPYRGPTHGSGEERVDGDDVRGCLEAVGARYPGFREQIFDGNGRVHRFVKLFLNGEQLDPEKLDVAVSDDDAVEILAAISGG